MVVAGLVFGGIAAALHVYIFYLESMAWTTPTARAVFGTSVEEAEATRELAFNQGFYNLFLAIAVAVGIIAYGVGETVVGATLVFVGAGSMVAAGLVLWISSPSKRGAALKQLSMPLLAVVALGIGLAI